MTVIVIFTTGRIFSLFTYLDEGRGLIYFIVFCLTSCQSGYGFINCYLYVGLVVTDYVAPFIERVKCHTKDQLYN